MHIRKITRRAPAPAADITTILGIVSAFIAIISQINTLFTDIAAKSQE